MLKYAHGEQVWNFSDGAGTTYAVSGLGFEPKLIIAWMSGCYDGNDWQPNHNKYSLGVCRSISDRRGFYTTTNTAQPSANTTTMAYDDAVICGGTPAGGRNAALDIDDINADGFRFRVDDAIPTNPFRVHWQAFGGNIVVTLLDMPEPAATGTQDYSVPGFEASPAADDQALIIFGVQQSAALNTVEAVDGGFCFGATTSPVVNVVAACNTDDNSGIADTDGYARTGQCIAMMTIGGGNPDALAHLDSWLSGGFRLNWTARAVTDRRYFCVAIKGERWRAGSCLIDCTTLNATQQITGIVFQPIGLNLFTRFANEDAASTSTPECRLSLGCGSSTASRRAQGFIDIDGADPTSLAQGALNSAIAVLPGAAANEIVIDLDNIDHDSFRLIVDQENAGGPVNGWVGYLTFGSAPDPTQVLMGRGCM